MNRSTVCELVHGGPLATQFEVELELQQVQLAVGVPTVILFQFEGSAFVTAL
jgi:hypothetical protein